MSDKRTVLIGVDESHADSREALVAAFSFVRMQDKAVLFSVIPHSVVSDDVRNRLQNTYASYANELAFDLTTHTAYLDDESTVAKTFLKEASVDKANLLVIGAGVRSSSGALGSVASDLVQNAYRHLLIVKRQPKHMEPGKPRTFLFACDGSKLNIASLQAFAAFLTPTDAVRIVTLSAHNGERDKAIFAEATTTLREANPAFPETGITTDFIATTVDKTIGAQLCDSAADLQAHALVIGTSRTSVKKLGSTTNFCVAHSAVSLLVLKVVAEE